MDRNASALGRGDRDAADHQIEMIAFEPRAIEKRPSVPFAYWTIMSSLEHLETLA